MKTTTRNLFLLVIITFAFSLPCRAGSVEEPGQQTESYIQEIHGTAYWRKNSQSAPMKLDPKKHKNLPLNYEEGLRCDTGGLLKIILYGKAQEIHPPDWFPIPRRPEEEPPSDTGGGGRPREEARAKILTERNLSVDKAIEESNAKASSESFSMKKIEPVSPNDNIFTGVYSYFTALSDNNSQLAESRLSSDFTFIAPDGSVATKQEQLADIQSGATALKFLDKAQDARLHVYTDSAIITGVVPLAGKMNGREFNGRFRITQFWIKQSPNWQLAAIQFTRIEGEAKK